jgi:hypothetical protein
MAVKDWDGIAANVDRSVSVPEDAGIINEKLEEIVKIADDVIDILKDGLQYSDAISFFEVVGPLMSLANTISEEWDEDKKDQFVVDAVYLIYKTVDTYPDGNQNNIDVPLLFGGLERGFEKKTLDFATRSALKALRSYIEKQD